MKIALICQCPHLRGAEIFARDLGRAVEDRGHRAHQIFLQPGPAEESFPGATVLGSGGATDSPIDLRLLLRLRRLVSGLEPDVVLLNGSDSVKYGALLGFTIPSRRWALVYRSIGRPGDWLGGALNRFVYRRLFGPRFDGIVSLTGDLGRELAKIYGTKVPIRTIPNAVDPGRLASTRSTKAVREALETPADLPVLLFVGALAPEKRVDLLLRATAGLDSGSPGVISWLAGSGPLEDSLKELAEELGIKESVRFLGPCQDVADLMRAADVLVLPSDTEGAPGVVLEAGLCELPTVATAVGGVPELVEDGETGILVPKDDVRALSEALREILGDSEQPRRRRMGVRARELVESRFTIQRIADEYLDFYRELLARRRN